MQIDRRRSPRIELLGQVQGTNVTHGQAVCVREISLGGMAIETPMPFDVGTVHAFRLTLGDDSTVELVGRVMHSRRVEADGDALSYLTGIQFVDDESEDGPSIVERIVHRAM